MPFRLKRLKEMLLASGEVLLVIQGIDGAGWSVLEINPLGGKQCNQPFRSKLSRHAQNFIAVIRRESTRVPLKRD